MIISASRRTDIPAFYAKWFLNRIRAGFCEVPNPYNRNQVARVSLLPADVDVIVFWTRNPKPLFPYLDELQARGYRYYFQISLLGYPRQLDRKGLGRATAISHFQALSDRIGPPRVIWRYDPIVFSNLTGAGFHAENYAAIAQALQGYTRRSVISVMDWYAKLKPRVARLKTQGVEISLYNGQPAERYDQLMRQIAATAQANQMQIFSCAEERDLTPYGIQPGKCVDDDYIHAVFDLDLDVKKDTTQRAQCNCVRSKDIGMYDSCLFKCQYCYANSSFARARANFAAHDLEASTLL